MRNLLMRVTPKKFYVLRNKLMRVRPFLEILRNQLMRNSVSNLVKIAQNVKIFLSKKIDFRINLFP